MAAFLSQREVAELFDRRKLEAKFINRRDRNNNNQEQGNFKIFDNIFSLFKNARQLMYFSRAVALELHLLIVSHMQKHILTLSAMPKAIYVFKSR